MTRATHLALPLLVLAAPLAAQDTFACDPLGRAIAEERLPVEWEPATGSIQAIVDMGDPAVCRAALDVITPSGISEVGVWDGACLDALRAVDDLVEDDPEAAAQALPRVAIAAGTGDDCAAALAG